MRKRNISYLFDTIFWYLLYALPLIVALIFYARTGTIIGFSQIMVDCGLAVDTSSIVYTTLLSIVGTNGSMPLFASADIVAVFTYFINVLIAHLLVDFVLFIPRLAHDFMFKFTGGDD